MSIADEIEARIHHLQEPGVTWVPGPPQRPGEECLLFAHGGFNYLDQMFSSDAHAWLSRWFRRTTGDYYDAMDWNDRCESLDQLLAELKDAWRDAAELDI